MYEELWGQDLGWTEGRMHTEMDKGQFSSPPLPMSGDKNLSNIS